MAANRGSDQNEDAIEDAEIVETEVENSADDVAEVYNPDEDAFEAEAPVNAKTAPTVIAPANDNDQPRANILAKRGRRWARLRNRR